MKLKINESKILEFNTAIEGGEADDLSVTLRILIDNIEYGFFPISLSDKKIKVEIPPLKDYVREENLKNVKKVSARLDIIAKDKLFTPWRENNINLEIPLEVKAEMTDMTDIKGILDEANIKVNIEENIDDKIDEGKSDKKKSKFMIMLEKKK